MAVAVIMAMAVTVIMAAAMVVARTVIMAVAMITGAIGDVRRIGHGAKLPNG
jgi:hypothetical protein